MDRETVGIAAALGLVGQLGLIMVAATALPLLAGAWLDRRLGTDPLLAVLLMVFGIAGGAWACYRRIVRTLL